MLLKRGGMLYEYLICFPTSLLMRVPHGVKHKLFLSISITFLYQPLDIFSVISLIVGVCQ